MRIDKYLWCIRYYKTRNVASTAVKKGQVKVNGSVVKPSREVYPMDKVVLRKNQVNYELMVLDIPESRVGYDATVGANNLRRRAQGSQSRLKCG